MGDETADIERPYFRVVVIHEDGSRDIRAHNLSLMTARVVELSVRHMGQVVIEPQHGIDRAG
jgi:hypothetical protein